MTKHKQLPAFAPKDFEEVLNEIQKLTADVLRDKGREYQGPSGSYNVLANFDARSFEYDVAPETALMIFGGKHFESIRSYVRKLEETGDLEVADSKSSEPIEMRIVDLINYMLLLAACIKRRRIEKSKTAYNMTVEVSNTPSFL